MIFTVFSTNRMENKGLQNLLRFVKKFVKISYSNFAFVKTFRYMYYFQVRHKKSRIAKSLRKITRNTGNDEV